MIEEIWKSIPEYPDYEVSNLGRVRSYRRKNVRILKTTPDTRGYLQVHLHGQGHTRVHKLVMLAFVGPCPDGMEVCHGPDGLGNNCLDNLRYDTHLGNMQDRIRDGINRHLAPEQTSRIRQDFLNGVSLAALSKKYGISQGYIKRALQDIYSFGLELKRKRIVSIREEYARGDTSYSKLAKKHGVDQSYICVIVLGKSSPQMGGPIKGVDY